MNTNPRNNTSKKFEEIVNLFWDTQKNNTNANVENELEVKFGTIKGLPSLSRIDFDNVAKKLISLGFKQQTYQTDYHLNIQSEYIDNSGSFRLSSIRTEINGINNVREFCNNNDISILLNNKTSQSSIKFNKKEKFRLQTGEKTDNINFYDYNFRVSFNKEEKQRKESGPIRAIIENWNRTKKLYRYIARDTFVHKDYPLKFDLSITRQNMRGDTSYSTKDANVFNNQPTYEIEIEVDNTKLDKSYTSDDILYYLRRGIKIVLSGLQETNYPISIPEQQYVLDSYRYLLYKDEDFEKIKILPSNFLGYSSRSLQIENIAPITETSSVINIRRNYCVTEKADGSRCLLFITSEGKIYLINMNMKVIFTGAITKNKSIFSSIIDGELILHNKLGNFINLFACFDIYYVNKKDFRTRPFIPLTEGDMEKMDIFRINILRETIKRLSLQSFVDTEDGIPPLRIEVKTFYTNTIRFNIFDCCDAILTKQREGLFEYNVDGLIFTPCYLGVGGNKPNEAGKKYKKLWEYSFKWKPAKYNTVDFLISTKKNENNVDIITPIFQEGISTTENSQIQEYKTIILMCGFNEKEDNNPFEDMLNDVKLQQIEGRGKYVPKRFYPTDPYDTEAGITNIILKTDKIGMNQMMTDEEGEEAEVFGDYTIVEFKYDLTRKAGWRWIPIRVRHDKTEELLSKKSDNYGNSYKTANNNWRSIHNPITEEMISGKELIPSVDNTSEVYYNRNGENYTKQMRIFNNYVKRMLITNVSQTGHTLIDYACGKAGDIDKWIKSRLSFVFGIDISKDNIENKLDGACMRYLNAKKDYNRVPSMIFLIGDCSHNIQNGSAFYTEKTKQITSAIFGKTNKVEQLGKNVVNNIGKGENGFNISSCQFAIHYFFKNKDTLKGFIQNITQCTKIGGYFIGTCYDGTTVFNKLNNKRRGESITSFYKDVKIWEVRKDYDFETFEDNISSLGYAISVYQDSINKLIVEYLVNFDYLKRIMQNFGFILITKQEADDLNFPNSTGMFKDFYTDSFRLEPYEMNIAFLCRYFIFKKITEINVNDVVIDENEETHSQTLKRWEEEAKINQAKYLLHMSRKKEEETKEREREDLLEQEISIKTAEEMMANKPDSLQQIYTESEKLPITQEFKSSNNDEEIDEDGENMIFIKKQEENELEKEKLANAFRNFNVKNTEEAEEAEEMQKENVKQPKTTRKPKAKEETTKQKCPKGTRRNKNTNLCEPIAKNPAITELKEDEQKEVKLKKPQTKTKKIKENK